MIQFDFSSIPSTATIESAVLEINYSGLIDACAYNTSTSLFVTPGSFTVHKVTKAWDEVSSVKWGTHATSLNNSEEDTYTFTPGSCDWADFDVTSAVSGMVSGSEDNNGFVIVTHSPTADNSTNGWGGLWTYFASSDTSDVSIRPKLTITYSGGTAVEKVVGECAAITTSLSREQLLFSNVEGRFAGYIMNLKGQKVHDFSGVDTQAIELKSGLTAGMYLISVESAKGIQMMKAVVK